IPHHKTGVRLAVKPPPPDPRDLTRDSEEIARLLMRTSVWPVAGRKSTARMLLAEESKRSVDLRQWCPEVRYQGLVNTCQAFVVAQLLEYFEQKAFGQSVNASRRFLYRVALNFHRVEGGDPN